MLRRFIIRSRRLWRRIVRERATPHNIAAGCSIGVFLAFQPIVGLQMTLGFIIATLVRVSRPAAMIPAWITNPVTIPPIYYFQYLAGTWIVGGQSREAARAKFAELAEMDFSLLEFSRSLKELFQGLGALGWEILWPLIVGCLVCGGICGMVTYPLVRRAVDRLQKSRTQKREYWLRVLLAERAIREAKLSPQATSGDPAER